MTVDADAARVEAWLASGSHLHPARDDVPGWLDLAGALAAAAGGPAVDGTDPDHPVRGLLGEPEHLIFILIDGMGQTLLEELAPPGGFLRSHQAAELRAIFPATTAAALTSLFTCAWPAHHGVLGWWLYLPDRDRSLVSLPFTDRHTGQPIAHLRPGDIHPLGSVLPQRTHACCSFLPAAFVDSAYSVYLSGGTARAGYTQVAEVLDRVRQRCQQASSPTYSYVYLPQLDAACHQLGPGAPEVRFQLSQLEGEVARLHAALGPGARLVISADHGHVPLPTARQFVLEEDDPLLALLVAPPSGEPNTPIFHVQSGQQAHFAQAFRTRFGEHFALLQATQALDMQLFGPGRASPVAVARLGDFVGIARRPSAFYARLGGVDPPDFKGIHAGMTAAEMRIPLIVA